MDAHAAQREATARVGFWALWWAVLVVKIGVAAMLPLFVDEAFYWQEGQHLAAAYSDLPGLTAWLTRLGTAIGGNHLIAVRAPFLLLAALVPLVVVRIASREFGERNGWLAGVFTLLLPLAGTLGILALPDAPMALATLLCADAGAKLLRRVSAGASLELAAGLAIGALSHYRFIAVIAVGFFALLLLNDGRRALRDPRVWTAIALGASAWAPLVAWNFDNADAGLRFQLVDRHPWAFHADGALFVLIQAAVVTPLLLVALLAAGWRARRSPLPSSRYFALLGLLVVLGFFVLGFFADTERVSFHWPLPGYLALLPLLPGLLDRWPRWTRVATAVLAGVGLILMLGYYAAVSVPLLRAQVAAQKWYPSNFAGWGPLADAVRQQLVRMPPGTRVVADNFKVGAELGFALGDASIPVLDHPLNHKHGRAPQLKLWRLETAGRSEWGAQSVLLVVAVSEVEYKNLHAHYRSLCGRVGPLPPPQVLNIDHGRQRFLLFAFEGAPAAGPCTTPGMAWIDAPSSNARIARRFTLSGWAFKDGVGLAAVDVLLDGRPIAGATYGLPYEGLQNDWPGSTDPQHPDVGFRANVVLGADVPAGRHWLGLRLRGRDGSTELWPEQPVVISD